MIILDDEIKYTTLYDHYKETITFIKNDLIKRNKLTLIIFVLLIIYFFIELKPNDSILVANTLVKNKLDFTIIMNYEILNIGILFFIFLALINYFSLSIYIEKQYSYIHKVEENLNNFMNKKLITRESYWYLEEYPLLSALIDRIYKFFLPSSIILCMLYKFIKICTSINSIFDINIINLILVILIALISFLYLIYVYRDIQFVKVINKKIKLIFLFFHLYKEDD